MSCFQQICSGINGIREPLYITAMRYAGIDITKEKKPSHVDFVDLDEHDKEKLRNWFFAQPLSYKEPEKETLLEVKNLSFGYNRGQQTLKNVSLSVKKGEMVSIDGAKRCRKINLFKTSVRF